MNPNTNIRTYSGKVDRVVAPNTIDVTLQLGFGVSILKRVRVLDAKEPNEEQSEMSVRILIALCGGKSITVHADGTQQYDTIMGHVYVQTKRIESPFAVSSGVQNTVLDVAAFLNAAKDKDYALTWAIQQLRGT